MPAYRMGYGCKGLSLVAKVKDFLQMQMRLVWVNKMRDESRIFAECLS